MATNSGSAISARVIPTACAAPDATIRSAWSRSTIRVVAITGTPASAPGAGRSPAIASSAAGGGGAIHVDPRYDAEWPRASDTKSTSPVRAISAAISAQRAGPSPSGSRSLADKRTPTAISRPTSARIAPSTSRPNRNGDPGPYPSPRVLARALKNCAARYPCAIETSTPSRPPSRASAADRANPDTSSAISARESARGSE